ncbi:MAG TPA: mechanosensitive ion channel family protein [Candidatus Acidoferrales bacterium]|nr:mechanosensitive ion channel family protein [Candidatus Acidoferrales bacterium]
MRSGLARFRRVLFDEPTEVLLPLAIFAAAFLAGWVVRRLVLRALHAWNERKQSRNGRILEKALRGPTLIWCVILAAHLGMQSSDLPSRLTGNGADVLLVLWVCSLTLMCTRLVGDIVRLYGDQIPGAVPVTTLGRNLAQIVVVTLGISSLLFHFNKSPAPYLTALGVGGLAVALALQDTLSNVFGGFYVAVARQVQMGDYVKLNTGEEGYVTDIGWRCTTFRALANNMIIVPNAKLSQAIVTNYSLPEKWLGSGVQVTVAMDSDPDLVERVLLEIGKQGAGEILGMRAEAEPAVAFDPGFTESGLGFSLNYQVSDFASQPNVRNELRRRILRRFRAEGIVLPFPARNLYMQRREKSEERSQKSGDKSQKEEAP